MGTRKDRASFWTYVASLPRVISNIWVYRTTLSEVEQGEFEYDGAKIPLEESAPCIPHSWYSMKEIKRMEAMERKPFEPVQVVGADIISTAVLHAQQGEKVALLNMASSRAPGGRVQWGAMAQEEEIARRSTLLQSLDAAHYPLEQLSLFSPNIYIFKDENYQPLPQPVSVAVLSVAAPRKPTLDVEGESMSVEHQDALKQAVFSLFAMADQYDIDTLVLGALGCGAYKNPPLLVAECFRDAMTCFPSTKKIVFAIMPVDGQNFSTFSKILSSRSSSQTTPLEKI